jgi:lipopolysaccharide export system protein LptC
MKRAPSAWLPIGLVLLLAGLTYAWLARVIDIKPREPDKTRHDPDIIVENFTARQLGVDGNERYTLSAQKMLHFADDDSTLLEGVNFVATEQEGPPLTVRSTQARLTSKADEVFFLGQVRLVREPFADRQRITADTTYFHVIPDSGIGRTDQPVTMKEGDNHTMTAQALEINNKTRIAILSKVKATYSYEPVR